ncbi:NAD(P)/FAD-dependent oxidoreductase [Salinarimonas soli]|uniref:FAD-binding oxidoreductase n=1 Tax=Salinarimonas soli TaxID=1638099 RepID=A0A5B2VXJ4_9HYPH|nr:FAD-dependent oxidoreductase [Salinarimonas soli]KAA2244061.1 FAD-binding oxidoreductase [Salinarimonas soli]
MSTYPRTYYSATLGDAPLRDPVRGRHQADVAVVGAGLAGLTAALELARAGQSVIVVEAERVGWGASGRNGGFVGPGYATGHDQIARMAGEENAKTLHRLSIEGVRIVEENLREIPIPEASPVSGRLKVLRHPGASDLARSRDRLARDFDYPVEVVPTERVREMLRSTKYFEALYDPGAFHFHPLHYAHGLARGVEAAGGRIFESSRVVEASLNGPEKRLRTRDGEIRARDVVLAAGGYADRLVPRLRRSFLPIATYVLLTEPARERIAEAVRTPFAISDERRAGDYYRLVDGGERLLWGGRITTRTSEPRRLAEMLRRTMVSTYPQIEGLRVEIAWSGLMAYARHLMPLVGRLQPGVWHALGFGGHGLNTTAIAGRVVAEAIMGRSDRIRLYEPFGLAWNGGPFGVAAAQLTYWSYQAADLWRERRAATR